MACEMIDGCSKLCLASEDGGVKDVYKGYEASAMLRATRLRVMEWTHLESTERADWRKTSQHHCSTIDVSVQIDL